jgi:hypothetical protein
MDQKQPGRASDFLRDYRKPTREIFLEKRAAVLDLRILQAWGKLLESSLPLFLIFEKTRTIKNQLARHSEMYPRKCLSTNFRRQAGE